MKCSEARIFCFFSILIICLAAGRDTASGEVVKLRDGREIVCKVVREDATRVWVRADSALMVLDRSQIVSIESGLSDSALIQRLEETLQEARRLLARGQTFEARRKLERELWRLDQELSALDTPSSELLGLRRQLKELHYNALANDPDQREAQRLYEKAQECLNRIDYPGAYEYLMRATSLAPNRLDIQYHLAQTAEIVNKPRVAMEAYGAVLQGDHLTYYDSVARSYLSHLLRHGRQALLEDKARSSLPFYEQIVLLQGEKGDEPVSLPTFGERLDRRKPQSRIETLIDVFDYARPRIMVDLAKAAMEEAHELDPDNKELARNLVIWRFLSLLKRLVEQGDHEGIIKLKSEMPSWALEDPEVRALIDQIEGAAGEAMKAGLLLEQVETALAAGDCEQAVAIASSLIEQFPESLFAGRAREIMARCEAEMAIREGIAKASMLISELKISEAEELVEQLIAMAEAEGLEDLEELQALAARIDREREAAEIWSDAAESFGYDAIEEGKIRLETLSKDYPRTQFGRYATLWLAENGERLQRREYVLANMTQGVASIVLSASQSGSAAGSTPEARLKTMSSLEALIQADRPDDGPDWLLGIQIVVPLLLSLFLLSLLMRKLVWPGGARFGLQMDEYFQAKRFRADPWGSSEEVSGAAVDPGALTDSDSLLSAELFPPESPEDEGESNLDGSGAGRSADAPTIQPVSTDRIRARLASGQDGTDTEAGIPEIERTEGTERSSNHRPAPTRRKARPEDSNRTSRERRSS